MRACLKQFICVFCAAVILLCLCGCGSRTNAEETAPATEEKITLPTAPAETEPVPTETDPKEAIEELAVVMDAGELYMLEHYPNLKRVDLSGSTCYGAIVDFVDKHPHLDVTYTVPVGSAVISNKETAATLTPEDFVFDTLLTNLQYLPGLTSLSLSEIPLNAQQVNSIQTQYPNLTMDYTVELFGMTLGVDATTLDLSSMSASQVDEAIPKLGLLTNLTDVTLSNSLSMTDVARLQDANTNATFHYRFTLFGQNLSTTDEEVQYVKHTIGNDGEEKLRQALAILDNCKRFVLDNCGLDNEVLAAIREDFRGGPKVVWRVFFGRNSRYSYLTDVQNIRTVENVTDSTVGPLRYCEDAVHVDMGHNDTLTDSSFVQYMPNLETLILSGSAITSVEGFENCKKLTWLELAYCAKLKDVTPLAGCENLKFLNLSFTGVKDYMPLDGLPLERFMCLSPKASKDEQNIFLSIHPKDTCLTVFYGYTNPYGYGWRYNDNGKTMFWYYEEVVRVVFKLDEADAILAQQKKNSGSK